MFVHLPAQASDEDWWFAGYYVLLVEDNKTNQEVAQELFDDVALRFDICENGLQAVQAVQARHYDLVLMDIQMPVMDGIEATKKIRALQGKYLDLPIIAMTANALAGDREKSLAAGMNAHITKPIDPTVLYQALSRWLTPKEKPDNEPSKYNPTPEQFDLPPLPGINVEDGLQRLRGNGTAYQKILKNFWNKHADTAQRIEQAITLNQLNQAAQLIHTIKGSSGNIGADALYEQASTMEQACLSGDQETAMACLNNFRTQWQTVMTSLLTLKSGDDILDNAPELAPASLSVVDEKAINTLLEQLVQYLNTDVSEAQQCFDTLKTRLTSPAYITQLDALEKNLNNFNIEAAQAIALQLQSLKIPNQP